MSDMSDQFIFLLKQLDELFSKKENRKAEIKFGIVKCILTMMLTFDLTFVFIKKSNLILLSLNGYILSSQRVNR